MNIRKKTAGLAFTATLLAALVATIAAPLVRANSPGNSATAQCVTTTLASTTTNTPTMGGFLLGVLGSLLALAVVLTIDSLTSGRRRLGRRWIVQAIRSFNENPIQSLATLLATAILFALHLPKLTVNLLARAWTCIADAIASIDTNPNSTFNVHTAGASGKLKRHESFVSVSPIGITTSTAVAGVVNLFSSLRDGFNCQLSSKIDSLFKTINSSMLRTQVLQL